MVLALPFPHPSETNVDTKPQEAAHVKRSILVRTVETRDGEVCVKTEQPRTPHSTYSTTVAHCSQPFVD